MHPILGLAVTTLIGVPLVSADAVDAPSIIGFGGFEDASAGNQARGWCAWGGNNNIVEFQRVTTGAHSGTACMMLMPTKQYLINGRDNNWVRPQAGTDYRVTFWARTDLPHRMGFWIGQYTSVDPIGDFAGEILRAGLDVGARWQQYSARIPAASIRTPILYLAFQATVANDLDRLTGNLQAAVYIDDVAFTPIPTSVGELVGTGPDVVNGSTRIAAADEATSEVDLSHTRPANRKVMGIALHRVNGGGRGQYSPVFFADAPDPLPVVVDNMKPLGIPSTRVYAVGVEPWPVEETLERLRRFCGICGIPPAAVVVELETQGATAILPPETWAQAVRYNRDKRLGFRLWEISNEPYAGVWDKGAYFKTPQLYADHVVACAKAIRAADPSAQVGLSIDSRIPGWGNTVIRAAAGSYDFACPHYYAGNRGFGAKTYYESALATCWETFDWTRRDLADLRAANGGKRIPLQVTEWAGVGNTDTGKGTDLNPAGTNIVGAIHRAIRQVWYLREDLVDGAMQWQSHAPRDNTAGFAFFFWQQPLGGRTLVWYLSDLLLHNVGDTIVADRVSSPMIEFGFDRLPVVHSVCTRDSNTGAVRWVLVNAAREETVPCTLSIKGKSPAARGRMTTLTQALDASPVISDASAVTQQSGVTFAGDKARVLLPPHSISVVEVK